MRGATLLFAHGGGFCKETWEPIVRRVQASALLRRHRAPVHCVTFDFPFHGTKRDESVAPIVHTEPPRVTHPGNEWLKWSSAEVLAQAARVRAMNVATPLIGIGHSMGAAALWSAEVKHPGTFDGLVLFEPVTGLEGEGASKSVDFLVALTLQRESRWQSRDAAVAHFDSLRNFAAWDRESLESYVRGGVVLDVSASVAGNSASQEVVLACSPFIEASLYSGKMLALSESEVTRPQCHTIFQSGDRSQLFGREYFERLVARLPHIYSLGQPIPNASHLMVFEDPAESAARIVHGLAQLPSFSSSANMP